MLGLHWSLYAIAVTRIGDITALVIIQLCLSSDDDHGSIMRVVSAGVPDMGSCGIDIYIWLWAVVHDGSPFVEARQAGLVGAVVDVCLLLLALAKLGSAALETLSDELETLSEISSTSTDKFLSGNIVLHCVTSSFLFLSFLTAT